VPPISITRSEVHEDKADVLEDAYGMPSFGSDGKQARDGSSDISKGRVTCIGGLVRISDMSKGCY
jgi:hypothetical protein